jgi:hypothetical protein
MLKSFEKEKEIDAEAHFELQKQAGVISADLTPQQQKTHTELILLEKKIKCLFDKIKTTDNRAAICRNQVRKINKF